MASTLVAMASNLLEITSNLLEMASNLLEKTFRGRKALNKWEAGGVLSTWRFTQLMQHMPAPSKRCLFTAS